MRNLFLTSAFVLFSLSFNAFAAELSCTPIAIKSENKVIILPGPEDKNARAVYFFKNTTSQSIWIDHPVEKASASAGWSSYLRPGNSSALLVNRKNFTISCDVIKPGNVVTLDCEKSVSICAVKQITISSKRKGTYWLAEDKPWGELLKALEKRGVHICRGGPVCPP
jgi:hypothetical protein